MILPSPVGEEIGTHKKCGGAVQAYEYADILPIFDSDMWKCDRCDVTWMREDMMRLELEPRCVLVWVEDKYSGQLHTELVPVHLAAGRERVRL